MTHVRNFNISKFPGFAFFVFFPGFFVYHSLVAFGYISPFLGGFFRPVAILGLPIFIYILARRVSNNKVVLNRLDIIFFGIMLHIAVVCVLNFAFGKEGGGENEVFLSTLSRIILNFPMYCIARTIDYQGSTLRKVFVFSLLGMCGFAFLNIGQSGIFYLALDASNQDAVAGYQGFGRSIVVSAIFVLALTNNLFLFVFYSMVSIAGLFVNGARSELIGFIFSLAVMVIYKFHLRSSVFGFVVLVSILLVAINAAPSQVIEGNRFMELVYGQESSSAIARSSLSSAAFETIIDNPVFGGYGSYALVDGGGIGNYAHNLLSAWVDLGIFGFALYLVAFFVMGLVFLEFKSKGGDIDKLSHIAIGFFSYTVLLMLFSKEYGYLLFGLTLGFVARLSDSAKRKLAVLP